MMTSLKKTYGIGSLSMVLTFIGLILTVSIDKKCIGDMLLEELSLPTWSNSTNGFHYTLMYFFLIFLIAYFIGKRYPDDLGAKLGKKISGFITVFLLISMVIYIV